MCGAYIGEQALSGQLCPTCLASLPRTEQAELRQNETEMALAGVNPFYVRDAGQQMVRAQKAMHLKRAAAFLFFEKEQPIQDVIHKMKYADQPMIAYRLGREAAMEMQYADFFDEIDVIIPIPLHENRLRSRGYNQSEYIARGLSEVTGIPLDTTHVTRIKDTPKQAQQKGADRKANVADAFAVNHPEQLYHKHILLVDDLLTTGETMRSCLKAMKRFRGAKFSVFALCKAR
jgi:ComF family protein